MTNGTAIKLTAKETAMVKRIGNSEYGEKPGDWIWAWYGAEDRSGAAVLGSLHRKGVIEHDGNSGDDACYRLTQSGIDAFRMIVASA